MATRKDILKLADHSPTGRHDQKALFKFGAELNEFNAEVDAGQLDDAATELADMAYYWCKMNWLMRLLHKHIVDEACSTLGVNFQTALDLAGAKYRLRVFNGKHKDAELEACKRVIRAL